MYICIIHIRGSISFLYSGLLYICIHKVFLLFFFICMTMTTTSISWFNTAAAFAMLRFLKRKIVFLQFCGSFYSYFLFICFYISSCRMVYLYTIYIYIVLDIFTNPSVIRYCTGNDMFIQAERKLFCWMLKKYLRFKAASYTYDEYILVCIHIYLYNAIKYKWFLWKIKELKHFVWWCACSPFIEKNSMFDGESKFIYMRIASYIVYK